MSSDFEERCLLTAEEVEAMPYLTKYGNLGHQIFTALEQQHGKTLLAVVEEMQLWIALASYVLATLAPCTELTQGEYHYIRNRQRAWQEAADYIRRLGEGE